MTSVITFLQEYWFAILAVIWILSGLIIDSFDNASKKTRELFNLVKRKLSFSYRTNNSDTVFFSLATKRIQVLKYMKYEEYLCTPEWKERARLRRVMDGHKCMTCRQTQRLNVHHNTYSRKGNEYIGDLVTLCKDCHQAIHEQRSIS